MTRRTGSVRQTKARRGSIRRRAVTMAEAVVCVVIVGLMLVAALSTVAVARTTEYRVAARERGTALARELMAEVMSQPYADPEGGVGTYQLESGETGSGSRALFDDMDDYDNWSASPPEAKDGTVMADLAGWQRAVNITRVYLANPDNGVSYETGVKRCIVTVSFNGAPMAELASLRSDGWQTEVR